MSRVDAQKERNTHVIPGLFVAAAFIGLLVGIPADAEDECLLCHDDDKLTQAFPESVHAPVSCTGCHADLEGQELPHETPVARVDCGACHSDQQELHEKSLHGQALARNDPLAPHCADCHGAHDILPVKDHRSAVAPLRVPFVCGGCHREGTPVQRNRNISQANIIENYSESIHGEGLLRKGLIVAPTCASCHTAHSILPHTDPASSIARGRIAATCAICHAEIEAVHRKIIEGELWEKEAHVLPACVDCHQPHEIRAVFYDQGMADRDCLRCHAEPGIKASADGRSLLVDEPQIRQSRHERVSCSQCHAEVNVSHVRPCETITQKVACASCHAELGVEFEQSVHGRLLARGDPNAPTCKECHGTHAVLGKRDTASATFAPNVPALCARCHREGEKAALRYAGVQREIIEHYTESIHGKGLLKSGLTVTATCTSCHTAHGVLPLADPASSVNRQNVPATCGTCHHGIEEQFERSIHAERPGRSGKPLPVCSDCHTAHTIRRADTEGFKLNIMNTCGRCHEEVARTYFDTYHGKVSQLGFTKTAKCYDCHGAHDVLPVSNPQSRLSRDNVVGTCQRCHHGATRRFAGYLTHATHHDPDKYPFLFWTFWGMTSLLVGVFVLGGFHTLLWIPRAIQMRRELDAEESGTAERLAAGPDLAPGAAAEGDGSAQR